MSDVWRRSLPRPALPADAGFPDSTFDSCAVRRPPERWVRFVALQAHVQAIPDVHWSRLNFSAQTRFSEYRVKKIAFANRLEEGPPSPDGTPARAVRPLRRE